MENLKNKGTIVMCDEYIDGLDDCESVLDEYIEDEALRLFEPHRLHKILPRLESVQTDVEEEIAYRLRYPAKGTRTCLCDIREAIASVLLDKFGGE